MKTPMTYENLPAHQPTALTQEQREDMPLVEWQAYTAPKYQHLRSTNTLGTWFIGHPSQSMHSVEPVELAYQLPMEEGESYQQIMEQHKGDHESLEAHRAWSKLSKRELGSVFNQDYAKLFVERALRQAPGQSAEQILLDAGFKFQHELPAQENKPGGPTRCYYLEDDKRGAFSVMLNKHSFWLTHQKRHANHWENLINIHTVIAGHDGKLCMPVFVSPHVHDILCVAAEVAVYFTQHWKPTPARRGPRRSP